MQTLFTGLRQSPATHSTDVTGSVPIAAPILTAEIAALDPAPEFTGATTDAGTAALESDVVLARDAGMNADLIASLPHGSLDALLPPAQATTAAPPVLSYPDVFRALGSSPWRDTLRADGSPETKLVRHEGLKKGALGRARESEGEVTIGPGAIAYNLAQRARQAGLADDEAKFLQGFLKGTHDSAPVKGDVELVMELLETENAASALRAFLHIQSNRNVNPDRITPDIMRALTLGVGSPRTAASEGREGFLSSDAAIAAAHALAWMNLEQYETITDALFWAGRSPDGTMLPGADAKMERALILKAIAVRDKELSHPEAFTPQQAHTAYLEVLAFASVIRGKDAQTLVARTSALDLDGDGVDESLRQGWQNASAAAVLQMLHAEYDPVYAWSLHAEGLSVSDGADEQAAMLESVYTEAVPRGDARGGGSGMVLATMAAARNPGSGEAYKRVTVDAANRAKTLDQIESLLKSGRDVAIAVSATPGERQAMAITDVRATAAGREFLVTDPWTGRTEWIKNQDLMAGNLGGNVATLTDYWS